MRLDLFLAEQAYAESRQKAQRLIKNGCVTVDGRKLVRPAEEIDENIAHAVEITETENERYVSRGGLKLEAALESFGVSAERAVCADIGASTGGFTDCLLKHGASKVYAFDSGKDQLHPSLAGDRRVVSKEGFNARYIRPEDVGENVDITVMDVSFISQTIILPALVGLMKPDGSLITLIKPQFEAGRAALGKNGIVKRKEDRLLAVMRVIECGEALGLSAKGLIPSPIKGGDGNEEFLVCFQKGESPIDRSMVKRVVIG